MSMTDQEIWKVAVNVGSWLATVIVTTAGAAWWLKGQLTGGQIANLTTENNSLRAEIGEWKARCEVMNERRLLVEDQRKNAEGELVAVKAQLEKATAQIEARAPKEAIETTLKEAAT